VSADASAPWFCGKCLCSPLAVRLESTRFDFARTEACVSGCAPRFAPIGSSDWNRKEGHVSVVAGLRQHPIPNCETNPAVHDLNARPYLHFLQDPRLPGLYVTGSSRASNIGWDRLNLTQFHFLLSPCRGIWLSRWPPTQSMFEASQISEEFAAEPSAGPSAGPVNGK